MSRTPVDHFVSCCPSVLFSARTVCVSSLTGAAPAFLALSLAGGPAPRPVLVVTPGIPEAERLAGDLALLAALPGVRARVVDCPPPGDESACAFALRAEAAAAFGGRDGCAPVAVAPLAALSARVPRGDVASLRLAVGDDVPFAGLSERLARLGYRRVSVVAEEGETAVRGGILDVWPPGAPHPLRAEFFGDTLESLRAFDAATQRSLAAAEDLRAPPVTEEACGETRPFAEALSPETLLVSIDGALSSLPDALRGHAVVWAGDPAPASVAHARLTTVALPGFSELDPSDAHHPELFAAARARLERHLEAAARRGVPVLRLDGLSGGFEIPPSGDAPGLVAVSRADRVFAKRRVHARRTHAGRRLDGFDTLEPGEYVVHLDYGVGRYIGSAELVSDGRREEVFTIEYADGAKLHVPPAQAHLLSRYVGVKGVEVRLHRLDGARWRKDRKDAQKAVTDLAAGLLETQARRETVPGFAYDVACDGLEAFEAAFPYEETPDQLEAIAAVKRDLAAPRPMDRLICGDAGYGKTEVAMRAAYIAALNGRQTAVLAPTTVLAEQHFETFVSRFDGTPVRIEALSRFQTPAMRRGTFARLANGACDIVVGTHALLSSGLSFRDLGLIVIDEEQRFGVRQKEHLKNLRATADVLTLSATPIPRTLYLSMTGARDLSLLRTPPRERVAVDTRIAVDSDALVRAAVEAELARGGQVFFLHNRVMTIGAAEKRLRALCPRARLAVAHGQMDAASLARTVRDFERGLYDVLLSTTIIESGVDIPRANTILVDHAERFGLAELYQLRGRVGRSSREGHAVFLLPEGGVDSDARERMKALVRHGGLGGGFDLAVRDLEIRGAGNLLGSQQSGHIAAVGFTLYCQLLRRTIARMKGEAVPDVADAKLSFDFASPSIPPDYVEEEAQRLEIFRRLAGAGDARDVRAIAGDVRDRFGRPPPAVRRLFRLAELRIACSAAGIARVDVRGARAVFHRDEGGAFARDLAGRTPEEKMDELESMLAPPAPSR